jgi:hypothetical protein
MLEMLYNHDAGLVSAGLALGMLAALELGYRLGRPQALTTSDALRTHINSVQASLLGLLALIIGFTFAVALQHYDARSVAVVTEANAIGTAWLRTALVAEPERGELRTLLRRYVDTRVDEGHETLSQGAARNASLGAGSELQDALWQTVARVVAKDQSPGANSLGVDLKLICCSGE